MEGPQSLKEEPFFDEAYADMVLAEPRGTPPGTQVEFLDRQILSHLSHPRVLDHCCGFGRHLQALTAKGYDVAGLDGNAEFLVFARREWNLDVPMFAADGLDPVPGGPYDVLLSLDASFSCFPRASATALLNVMREALKPGGELVLHIENPAFDERYLNERGWFRGRNGQMALEERDTSEPGICVLIQTRFHPQPGGGYRASLHRQRLCYYTDEEMRALLRSAGFRVLAAWGDWRGRPVDPDRSDLIYHCRRD